MSGFVHSKYRKTIESIELEDFQMVSVTGESVCEAMFYRFESGKVYQVSGKIGACTELLRALAFLQTQYQGNLWINNEKFSDMDFKGFHPYRLGIGYGFDQGGLLNNRSLRENLLLPLEYHQEIQTSDSQKLVDTYLHKFAIEEYKDLRPAMVPGFVRKLVCNIRALMVQPQVLVLDSPTASVDKERSQLLLEEVKRQLDHQSLKILIFTTTYENAFSLWQPKKLELRAGQLFDLPQIREVA